EPFRSPPLLHSRQLTSSRNHLLLGGDAKLTDQLRLAVARLLPEAWCIPVRPERDAVSTHQVLLLHRSDAFRSRRVVLADRRIHELRDLAEVQLQRQQLEQPTTRPRD